MLKKMKLALGNNNINTRYKKNIFAKSAHSGSLHKNSPSFTGDAQKIVKTAFQNGSVTYKGLNEISDSIDSFLGDKFFSSKLEKTHFNFDKSKGGILEIKDESLIKDLFNTIKYPFLDMPRDIANAFLRKIGQISIFKDFAEQAQKASLLQNRAQAVETEKNSVIVRSILDRFVNDTCLVDIKGREKYYNVQECLKLFKESSLNNIGNMAKNYSSRDERTLNRMVTATVSALYGANDFYNISMLQKDDKKEAKKAGRSRFKQEMTRMLFNSSLVFLTMGALDKYIKNNLVLSILSIAGSSLISEVLSRVINGVSLVPLTPEKAAKIANKKKEAEKINNPASNDAKQQDSSKKDIAFKNNISHEQTFVRFASKDGTLPALNSLYTNVKEKTEKPADSTKTSKKYGIKKVLGIAFGSASAVYFLNYFAKGGMRSARECKLFFDNNSAQIKKFLNGEGKLDDAVIKGMQEVMSDGFKKGKLNFFEFSYSKICGLFKKLDAKISYKDKEIPIKDIKKAINDIIDSREAEGIESILDNFVQALENEERSAIVLPQKRLIVGGISGGIKKMFDTLWKILSFPGVLVKDLVEKIGYKDSTKKFEYLKKSLNFNPKANKDQQLETIYEIIRTNKDASKAVQQIKNNLRHFESSPETAELANYSRALVTLISSYFFVNDYSNKVLIESAGKNVQEAKEERNERIAHKLSNFVINGTLMNIFNTMFNKQLNSSLLQASVIAGATEITNEFLVRKSICQPVKRMDSRDEIIEWEDKQTSKEGLMGTWSRFFRKITGKKTLTEKTGIHITKEKEAQNKQI